MYGANLQAALVGQKGVGWWLISVAGARITSNGEGNGPRALDLPGRSPLRSVLPRKRFSTYVEALVGGAHTGSNSRSMRTELVWPLPPAEGSIMHSLAAGTSAI